jgi:hypothetical protein
VTRYHGDRTIDGVVVTADGTLLSTHEDKLALTDKGFEWSYEGREPAQLAFALLVDHLGDAAEAEALHEDFMRAIVANFENEWEMTSADIEAAVEALRADR